MLRKYPLGNGVNIAIAFSAPFAKNTPSRKKDGAAQSHPVETMVSLPKKIQPARYQKDTFKV